MKFDDILREIGEFGPYQKKIYFYICIPSVSIGMFMFANVVLLGSPEHRCKIPSLDNDTYAVQSESHSLLINATIPPYDGDEHKYDQCHLYNDVNMTYDGNTRPVNATTRECHEWVYDASVFKNTFTKQMNLVCGDTLRVSFAQTTFYFGVLVGSFGFGQLSDIIGRKKTLYINTSTILVVSVSLAFVANYYLFVTLFFIIGCCCMGTFMTAYVIGMEFVGPSKRVWAGCIIHIFGTTGSMYFVLMSYLLRDWKYVELAIALPCVVYLVYWWILPESPRWLLSQGRKEEAEKILREAAKRNGAELQQKTLDSIEESAQKSFGFWKLFSTKTLAFRTTIIFVNWFIVSMAYYGVILNVGNLQGDFYVNLCLLTAAEYPVKALSIALMDRIGRKKLYIGFMIIGGLACIGTIFPLLYAEGQVRQVTVLILSVIGKMGVTGGFETIYVLSAELYPTVLRNVGMGSSSAFARAGSMLAPYVAQSAYIIEGTVGQTIPLTFFGVAAFIAGLLSLTLPETLNKKLPDTIEDTNNALRDEEIVVVYKPATNESTPIIKTNMKRPEK